MEITYRRQFAAAVCSINVYLFRSLVNNYMGEISPEHHTSSVEIERHARLASPMPRLLFAVA